MTGRRLMLCNVFTPYVPAVHTSRDGLLRPMDDAPGTRPSMSVLEDRGAARCRPRMDGGVRGPWTCTEAAVCTAPTSGAQTAAGSCQAACSACAPWPGCHRSESVTATWGFAYGSRLTRVVVWYREAVDPSSSGQFASSRVLFCLVQDLATNARQRSGWTMSPVRPSTSL